MFLRTQVVFFIVRRVLPLYIIADVVIPPALVLLIARFIFE